MNILNLHRNDMMRSSTHIACLIALIAEFLPGTDFTMIIIKRAFIKMTQIYDVVIVGAGPAELMAARELDANEVNYLIIDATSKIDSLLKCGEITRQDSFLELFGRTDHFFLKTKYPKNPGGFFVGPSPESQIAMPVMARSFFSHEC